MRRTRGRRKRPLVRNTATNQCVYLILRIRAACLATVVMPASSVLPRVKALLSPPLASDTHWSVTEPDSHIRDHLDGSDVSSVPS